MPKIAKPLDSFAFKDDHEKEEIYDEILDNRRADSARGVKWLIFLYLGAIIWLLLMILEYNDKLLTIKDLLKRIL